jgi:hypothetical protein
MAIAPLQLPGPIETRPLDFTPLSDIGKAIQDYQQRKLIGEAVQAATGPDGKVDANQIGLSLAKLGMTGQAMPFIQSGQTAQFHKDTVDYQNRSLAQTAEHQRATERQAAATLDETKNQHRLDLAKPFKAGEDYFGQPTYLARDATGGYVPVKLPDQSQQPRGQVPAAPQYAPAPQPNAPQPLPGPGASTFQDRFQPPAAPVAVAQNSPAPPPMDLQAEFLSTRPPAAQGLIKGIANYDIDPRTALARLPAAARANILSDVAQYRPDWNQQNYPASQAALTKFTSGKESAGIRSFNVGLEHLDQLHELGTALKNGNIQAVNEISNKITTWTGGAAPTNFNALKAIVGAEIVKAIVGAGGTGEERAAAAASVASKNSPEQLAGVIETYKKAMGAQLGGLSRTYETGTFRKDFKKFLSPAAQKAYDAHQKEVAQQQSDPQSAPVDWKTYFSGPR